MKSIEGQPRFRGTSFSIFSSACYLLHAGISCLPYSLTLHIEEEISTKL
jgi:hypothetical protein